MQIPFSRGSPEKLAAAGNLGPRVMGPCGSDAICIYMHVCACFAAEDLFGRKSNFLPIDAVDLFVKLP